MLTPPPPTPRLLALAAALSLGGLAGACAGGTVEGVAPPGGGAAGGPGETARAVPFAISRETAKLLPFRVRLGRVASVLGVDVADSALDPLREARVALGDHDFANGVLPDPQWSASRMADWIRALTPVCESAAFGARFPELPEQLPELITAAYGRESTVDDLADVDLSLEESGAPAERRGVLTCLAVLTSAEMVIQ